jgi:para-nitrobenzyl esterase
MIKINCLAGIALFLISLSATADQDPTIVTTRSGQVQGLADGPITSFLGVPYAAAPVGEMRWQPPAAVKSWQSIRSAKNFSNSCYQPDPPPIFGPYTEEFVVGPKPSEDCLYLNVWAPSKGAKTRPVLVFLHGGGFLGGSGAIEIYNGKHLASKGIVVVSINYRVGPFGFFVHPDLRRTEDGGTPGNYGILDQIAALKWVRDNIDAFGGDPDNVTLAGQSAGAISVSALMVSPAAKGLFHKAILESPVAIGRPTPSSSDAQERGRAFLQYLGSPSVAALRQRPAKDIQDAVWLPIDAQSNKPRIGFEPYVDGNLIPEDPMAYQGKRFLNMPMILGFTADEQFGPPVRTSAEFVANVRKRFGNDADALLKLYPHDTDSSASVSSKILDRDCYMTALSIWADRHTSAEAPPIYSYVFSHSPPVQSPPSFGAFHTAEVPYVFGVLSRDRRPYDSSDLQLSELIQSYWLNFMKSGNPNSAALPKWESVKNSPEDSFALDLNPQMQPFASSPERAAILRSYAEKGGTLIHL